MIELWKLNFRAQILEKEKNYDVQIYENWILGHKSWRRKKIYDVQIFQGTNFGEGKSLWYNKMGLKKKYKSLEYSPIQDMEGILKIWF